MELKDFINEVLTEYDEQITDSIVCFIQNDRVLMKKYLETVAATGNLQDVNKQIGREIVRRYGLKGYSKDKEPKSVLISSYSLLTENEQL